MRRRLAFSLAILLLALDPVLAPNMARVIFLQCFQDQRFAGIPRDAVLKAFAPFVRQLEPELWSVRYDPRNFCTLFFEPFDEHSIHPLELEEK